MGREARCAASWGSRSGEVTALLETTEVLVRGAFRASAPRASVRDVQVVGDTLRFRAGKDRVALVLGAAAPRWAAALAKPPPSLAVKLGIAPETRVLIDGEVDDAALAEALAEAGSANAKPHDVDLIVARVDDADALAEVAARHDRRLASGVPMWVVYTKGKAAPLGETAVIAMLRERGLIDLKVAAVSATLTALKFARRRQTEI